MTYLRPRTGLKLAAFLVLIVSGVLTLGLSQPPRAIAAGPGPVVVSLEFDDGTADQVQADSILASHGYHGVFFINSGRLGANGYMTLAQVQSISSDGHEIGGHTVNHVDLPTLDTAEQQRQVCNDRVALLANGFSIYDFAYPYGDYSNTTEGVVQGCNYNSARVIGGVVSPGDCHGCPYAETIPAADFYATLTPDSIKSDDTLADIEKYVTQANVNGGGWVQLVMHHLCSGNSCSPLSVDPTTLNSFLTWLQGQSYVTVKTAHEVIGGALQAPVNGPPSTSGTLQNGSFEAPPTGTPTCWKYTVLSPAAGTQTRISDAHSGSFAVKLTATSMASGGAVRVYSTQDLGTCSPSASGGEIYQINAWVKGSWSATSSSGLRLVTYYRNSSNGWAFGQQSPYFAAPAGGGWSQISWTTPALPTGTTAISVLVSLQAVGNVTVDDVSLVNAASDTTSPTVAVTAPMDGSTVTGLVNITATAADNFGVNRVEFYAGGDLISTDTSAPYTATWDSTTADQSNLGLAAKAYDLAGNTAVSAVNVTVLQPDRVPPVANLTTPSDGATVSGVVPLAATASDDSGITKVEFYVASTLIGTTTTTPYQINWDSTAVANGSYALTAKAYDTANNAASSNVANVTVSNTVTVPNLLRNPSLETSASGFPTCWLKGASGTNTATWTYTNDSHTGSFAVNVQISSFNSGDRKLVNTQDSGTCAPAVTPGLKYTLSAWYKSTVPTHFFVFYRNSAGNWVYWKESPNVAAAPSWTNTTWTSPAVPAGATYLSMGLGITQVGSLTQDDLSLTAVPDTTSPTVSLTAPANGATVNGTTSITASASDDIGVSRVEFYDGGNLIAPDTSSPYAINWDTTTAPNGTHTLTAKAYDAAGNNTVSASRTVTVNNPDNSAPTVALLTPSDGATVNGPVNITATASDNVGVSRVEFYVGTTLLATSTTSPYGTTWDTTTGVPNGSYQLSAKAYDAAGNIGTATAITVTVNNPDTTNPTVALTAPSDGATVSGGVDLAATANDNIGVNHVDFLIGNTAVATVNSSPYAATWDSTTVSNGSYTVTAKAYDAAGNTATSSTVTVTVSN